MWVGEVMFVPPSGGSLEIGNENVRLVVLVSTLVPPSGGSLEIGNDSGGNGVWYSPRWFPLRGDP